MVAERRLAGMMVRMMVAAAGRPFRFGAVQWRRWFSGQIGEKLLTPDVTTVLLARPVGQFTRAPLVAGPNGRIAGAAQAVAGLLVQGGDGAGSGLEGQPQGSCFVGAEAVCGVGAIIIIQYFTFSSLPFLADRYVRWHVKLWRIFLCVSLTVFVQNVYNTHNT